MSADMARSDKSQLRQANEIQVSRTDAQAMKVFLSDFQTRTDKYEPELKDTVTEARETLDGAVETEFFHEPHETRVTTQDEEQKMPAMSQPSAASYSQRLSDPHHHVEAVDYELPSPVSDESYSFINRPEYSTCVSQGDQTDAIARAYSFPVHTYPCHVQPQWGPNQRPPSDPWHTEEYRSQGQPSGDYNSWGNEECTTATAPLSTAPPPLLTRKDLSALIAAVSYFLNILQMIRRTMCDLYAPQDELEVASDTVIEGYQHFHREIDPILAKYLTSSLATSAATGLGMELIWPVYSTPLPKHASIETWEGVRDVELPPNMLQQLPPCSKCRRPGRCMASCRPLSKRSFATNMLEREKKREDSKNEIKQDEEECGFEADWIER